MARLLPSLELRVPPVAVVLLAAAAMWLLARALPGSGPGADAPGRTALAGLLALAGIAVALAGVVAFRRAHTTVNPMTPDASSRVVSTGIYRHSRNPMYLGMLLVLAGWAVWLARPANAAVLAAFVLYMNRFQIAPEERALRQKFGDGYLAYMQQVRRWL